MQRSIALLIFSCASIVMMAQSVNVPLNEDYQHKAERYRLLQGELSDDFHPSFKPYRRDKMIAYLESLDTDLNERDRFNFDYLYNDSWEYAEQEPIASRKTFLKRFYRNSSDLFHVDEEELNLHINPVIHFMVGNDNSDDDPVWINTRGFDVRGMIDDKVGFWSFVGENQMATPAYVDAYPQLPHIGFRKGFKGYGYDFFTVRGGISFQATKNINMQFGYDRHKIGQGMRSLMLSDFAPPNLYFRVQTQVWKFNYTNLYTQLTEERVIDPATGRYPEKYLTLHHLSLNLTRKLNIGLFEAIMSGGSEFGGYEIQYLNPIIFYRAIEQQNGSADNAMVGIDAEWLVRPGISLYGQFVLDEFLLSEIQSSNGWWGNKHSLQLGANYINAGGIENLDLKIEWNKVRPYTYAHYTPFGSYSHFEQPLAHPWGANFREMIFELRYQPIPRLELYSRTFVGTVGRDNGNENWGSDFMKDYNTREQDLNNEIGQGDATDIFFSRFRATYMWKHNLFFDLKYIYRKEESTVNPVLESHIINASLRWNIADRIHEF